MGTDPQIAERYDVAILGGGLAGLTLARQLRRANPDMSIFVAEKRDGPAPEASFKVGESSVELGANYFGVKIDMQEDLEVNHLPKMSLRYFYPAGDNSDLTQRIEFGTPFTPPVPSYQIDRGRFENELGRRNVKDGIDLVGGCRVTGIEIDPEGHRITVGRAGQDHTLTARWVVDASGRSHLLQRQLGLQESNGHDVNSSWLRLADGLDYEKWVTDDPEWTERVPTRGLRRLATTHLMGQGYWVWIIPLSSGSVSIGIVADPEFHPFEQINTVDAALQWLRDHEPQLAAEIDGRQDGIEDFLRVENFSYGCKQVYSGADRWALVGEAGPFLDPFYSPGSDFIGMGNTLVTDLITRDLGGEDVVARAQSHNDWFLDTYRFVLNWYEGQYKFFGDPQISLIKVGANNIAYWSTHASLFCHDKIADIEFREAVQPEIDKVRAVSLRLEKLFSDWFDAAPHTFERGHVHTSWFPAMGLRHVQLGIPMDDEQLKAKMTQDLTTMEATGVVIFHKAAAEAAGGAPDPSQKINPYAISLDRDAWEKDGLFDGSGMTLEEAHGGAFGIQNYWLDNPPNPDDLGSAKPDVARIAAAY